MAVTMQYPSRAVADANPAMQRVQGMLQAHCLTEHPMVPASWRSRQVACRMQRLPQAKQLLKLFRLQVSILPRHCWLAVFPLLMQPKRMEHLRIGRVGHTATFL